jgi:hypothetical protein
LYEDSYGQLHPEAILFLKNFKCFQSKQPRQPLAINFSLWLTLNDAILQCDGRIFVVNRLCHLKSRTKVVTSII